MGAGMYNRAVGLHKLMYEALMRLVWQGFGPWLEENDEESKSTVDSFFSETVELYDDICERQFQKHMTSASSVEFVKLFDKYMQSYYNEARIGKILKQQKPRKRFLRVMWKAGSKDHVGKNQARAELIRKFTYFCEKKTRYKKGTRTLDPLIKCVDLRGDASIRKAAIGTGDRRITGLASRDLVAAEAWYHGHCYRDYTRPGKASKHTDSESESPPDENNCCKIESQAYDKLFEFIRSNLLENPRLVKMVDLREKRMSYMRSMGATEILESTKKHTDREESWKKNLATYCNLKIS